MKIDKAAGTTTVKTTDKGIEEVTPVAIEVPLAGAVEADEAEDTAWGQALAKKVEQLSEEIAALKLLVKQNGTTSPDVQVSLTQASTQIADLTARVAALETP